MTLRHRCQQFNELRLLVVARSRLGSSLALPVFLLRSRAVREEFLELIYYQQDVLVIFGVEAAERVEQLIRARAELLVEILDELQSLGDRGGLVGQRSRDLIGQSADRTGSRPHGDRCGVGKYRAFLRRQFRLQAGSHDRGLAAARSADDGRKRPFPQPTAEFLDLVVATKEVDRVFALKWFETAIRFDLRFGNLWIVAGAGPRGLTEDEGSQPLQCGGVIQALPEVSPHVQRDEASNRTFLGSRKQHENQPDCVSALLIHRPLQQQLNLVLMHRTAPVRAIEDHGRTAGVHRVFEL